MGKRLDNTATWFLQHWRGVVCILVGLGAGFASGVLAWSWAHCAPGCGPRWDAVEATGTWFGGLGGIGAVLLAVVALRHDQQVRDEQKAETDAERNARERFEQDRADSVRMKASIENYYEEDNEHFVSWIRIIVTNDNDVASVFRVAGVARGVQDLTWQTGGVLGMTSEDVGRELRPTDSIEALVSRVVSS